MAKKRRKFYPPTFNGRHNALKCKVFYVLYELYRAKQGEDRYLTAQQLADATGCNYQSLLTRLPLFCRWKYLHSPPHRWGFNRYCITVTGRKYFDKYRGIMPLARYLREMAA